VMSGFRNGSSSSRSSARAMRMALPHVVEVQLAIAPFELPARFELEHPRDQTVRRMKHERVERSLSTGAVSRGILGEGELEEGVQLHALTTAAGAVQGQAARGDVAGADERAVEGGRGR